MDIYQMFNILKPSFEVDNKELIEIMDTVNELDPSEAQYFFQSVDGLEFVNLIKWHYENYQQRNISTGTMGTGRPTETGTGSTGTIQYSSNIEQVRNEHNNLEHYGMEREGVQLDVSRTGISYVQERPLQNGLLQTAPNVDLQPDQTTNVGPTSFDSSARLAQRNALRNQLPDIKARFERKLCNGRKEYIEVLNYIRLNYCENDKPFEIKAHNSLSKEISEAFPVLSPATWGFFLKDIQLMDSFFEILTDKMD